MQLPREVREQAELQLIGPFGVRAAASSGRNEPEEECDIRTCFQRDVDRITHCKAFRRLKHKTQVFLQPEGDHYRTRLTHTLEVSRLARTAARALNLNEDLTEAIALGHDLGHTPFGHAGERALNRIHPGGFRHYEQSLRVVDLLEREGRGLNLCYETRMGILNHTFGSPDDTLEAVCVRLCDRIAYVNHDLDDAIRAGLLRDDDVPERIRHGAGTRNSQRINSFLTDLITASLKRMEAAAEAWSGFSSGKPDTAGTELRAADLVALSPGMKELFDFFHGFMYSDIYTNPLAKGEESKVDGILAALYDYYSAHPEKLPGDFRGILEREGSGRAACDYISGMTDGYAMEKYGELFIPFAWTVK